MITSYPWHITQWQTILSYWQNQRSPQALLLTGPKGLGKLDFATNLATYLLCQSPKNIACGHCQSCHWLAANSHPDLFLLHPEEDSHVIKIEQVRELVESLQQTAQHGGKQVVIIEPAEAMNRAAANALLKTLEEPAGEIIFLLVAHQISAVPATIRSRCQKINFPVPTTATSLAWLKTQAPQHPHPELLLALAENIPLRALSFAEESHFKAHEKLLTQFIQLSDGQIGPLILAQSLIEWGWELVFSGLWLILMDLLRLKQAGESKIVHSSQRAELQVIANQTSTEKLFHFFDHLVTAKRRIEAKMNLNMQLLWERILIEWRKPC